MSAIDGATELFKQLFTSYTGCYGIYNLSVKKGKKEDVPKARTVTGVPDLSLHLSGKQTIGCVPLLDDGVSVRWAALDIDNYSLDIGEIAERVLNKDVPVIPCRTKSGGIHLYVFFSEDVLASEAQSFLRTVEAELKVIYGKPNEIFPKQIKRIGEVDSGNWINLPYFGGATDSPQRTSYFCGRDLTLTEFVHLANSRKLSREQLKERTKQFYTLEEEDWKGAPPCLITYKKQGGAGPGNRNEALFSLVIYAKNRWPGDWKNKVNRLIWEIVDKDNPISVEEIQNTLKSANRKSYIHTCKGPYCNKAECEKACFGRGVGLSGKEEKELEINHIIKQEGDPIYWIIEVEGTQLKATTEQIMSVVAMNKICLEKLNKFAFSITQKKWASRLQELLSTNLSVVESTADAYEETKLWTYISTYLTLPTRRAQTHEEIKSGQVFYDPSDDTLQFRGQSLLEYLAQRKANIKGPNDVYLALRERGVESKVIRIRKETIRVYSILASKIQQTSQDE